MNDEYKYFVLVEIATRKLYFLRLRSNAYVFIVTRDCLNKKVKNDFSLYEKLFILGEPFDVKWIPLSELMAFILCSMYCVIAPSDIKIEFSGNVNEPLMRLKIKDTYERIE